MNQSLKTEKAVLKNIYFEYKNSVIQSVAFKINYTYTIIKIACFFLTMCFKSSLYCFSVLKAYKPTTVIRIWLCCWGVPRCPRPTQGCSALTTGLCTPSLTTSQSVTKDGVQGGSACFCFFVCLPFLIQAKQT